MKKFFFSLMAVVLALTACNKFGGDKPADKIPEPKSGYLTLDGVERPIYSAKVDVKQRSNGYYCFQFYDGYQTLNVKVAADKLGQDIDLSTADANADKFYVIEVVYRRTLANGSQVKENTVLCRAGSTLSVKEVSGGYEVKFALKNKEGYSGALLYSGKFVPFIEDTNTAVAYYNKKFYTLTSLQSTVTSYGELITLKAASGFEVTIKGDGENIARIIDMTKTDPLASQSGKQPYEIAVKVGSSSATTIASGKSGGAHGIAGSEMEIWVDRYLDERWVQVRVEFASSNNELAILAPYTQF